MQAGLGRFMLNSLIVAGASIVIVCGSALAASYAIVRRTSRLAPALFTLSLGCLALPAVSVVIPFYFIMQHLSLYNSLWAVILPVSRSVCPWPYSSSPPSFGMYLENYSTLWPSTERVIGVCSFAWHYQ